MVDESGELREGEDEGEEEEEGGGALVHIGQYVQQAGARSLRAHCTHSPASQTAKGNFSTPAVECGHLHWSESGPALTDNECRAEGKQVSVILAISPSSLPDCLLLTDRPRTFPDIGRHALISERVRVATKSRSESAILPLLILPAFQSLEFVAIHGCINL